MSSRTLFLEGRMREVYPILLVEDNPDDITITMRAWRKGGIRNRLLVATSGEEALQLLRKEDGHPDMPTPCLVLLDLKMPRMDGFQLLEEIKGDDTLRRIPVVVLTSSERMVDIERAYMLGCNSYIVKPVSFEGFIRALEDIDHYWLKLSRIPMSR